MSGTDDGSTPKGPEKAPDELPSLSLDDVVSEPFDADSFAQLLSLLQFKCPNSLGRAREIQGMQVASNGAMTRVRRLSQTFIHNSCLWPKPPLLMALMLQAQRDDFGAHTYERVDRPRGESFHTNRTGRGGRVSSTTYNA